MSSMLDRLAEMDSAFEGAETKVSGETVDLPEGKYVVKVVKAEVFEAKTGRMYLKISFTPTEGDCAGMIAGKIYNIDDPSKMSFLKSDLISLGKGIQKLSQLPTVLDALVGVLNRVQVKKNGEYTNYFFNGRPAASSPTASDTKTEVPF